ncbi:dTDP-glucose 4,6-dehydratase [Pelotomaculum isophthalicicum JI]|uniref:dTDP-glucose 4,6-dehydratase n=1 Tax=Pelotomaculum isophthalicicum JI TaxID=947010 RepID=A0A9X4GY96_9FIRM|nr:dTDP-glucose 4,6-dehydratase [Pelotomaculum isophthalicicum]MDF9407580.1 dTDP-glucose 4,6-dehydratase [Pelotomaculum isophthalicicum JI]
MKILVTGGAGFIGSNFIRYILEKYSYQVINLDSLTYAGNLENLTGVAENPGYQFVRGDITDRSCLDNIFKQGIDAVINFAAETHVDRSITGAGVFIRTNVLGVQELLEAVRRHNVPRFLQVSTDEVYGSLGENGFFTEETSLAPGSPYSASKAAADLLALAYYRTFSVPVSITRCSNNYGPYQFPEKLIPLMVTNALEDKSLPLYGDGLHVRDWLHVLDHCRALDLVLHRGKPGEVYNIGGNNEWANIEIIRLILAELGKPESLIKYVPDRPGHDRRYAINAAKIKEELGWRPVYAFEQGLKDTINWYRANKEWWRKIKSGEYLEYYEKMYTAR